MAGRNVDHELMTVLAYSAHVRTPASRVGRVEENGRGRGRLHVDDERVLRAHDGVDDGAGAGGLRLRQIAGPQRRAGEGRPFLPALQAAAVLARLIDELRDVRPAEVKARRRGRADGRGPIPLRIDDVDRVTGDVARGEYRDARHDDARGLHHVRAQTEPLEQLR